ncbi:MAG: PHP domain-containing protein, partial [Oscillospiraceae bacterium]|nr:PHP domain-containing protein [Oscillospiraceae bacterium]
MGENLSALWPDFDAGAVHASAEKLTIDRDGREIRLSLFCDTFSSAFLDQLEAFLTGEYEGFSVTLEPLFAKECFCPDAFQYIVRRLIADGLPVNGFFHGASAECEEDTVTVTLTHGGLSVLEDVGFARAFTAQTRRCFGFAPTIRFTGVTEIKTVSKAPARAPEPAPIGDEDAPPEQDSPPWETAPRVARVPRTKAASKKSSEKSAYLALADDGMTILLGKRPSLNAIRPLEEVVDDGGRCTVWGDVFFFEARETRNGNTIYTVGITDYTSSVNIKQFDRRGDFKKLGELKVGDTVVVAGDIAMDRYENEFVLNPQSIAVVRKATKKDTAPEKRVELHLHTNMSAMDALPTAADVLARAHAYGHRAVAITDHGVAQAFPDAAAALRNIQKEDPDFKVIYGVECYYVDDSARVVSGTADTPLDGEMICFDLETTGLSAMAERIIEIGAVRIRGGEIVDSFDTFVDPGRPIPQRITELTHITDDMVAGAPQEKQALEMFFEYAKDLPLMAHNASFDMSFLTAALRRCGDERAITSVDTLGMAQSLLPDLKKHRLDTLTQYFKLNSFEHHRANDDAAALARIYFKFMPMLAQHGATSLGDVNASLGGRGYKHAKPNHMILLVRNQAGLKNLYQLITKGHLQYFYMRPRIPKSELMRHREGLILGSACEQGEVYRALVEDRPWEDVRALAEKYDYLEIQPLCNNHFMVDEGTLPDDDAILELNRRVVRLGEELQKPVCATCDVHFLDEKDGVYRSILMHGQGFTESVSAPLIFRTTDEMLAEFAYLGEETARRVVVDNTNLIASMIEPNIQPIPKGTFTPSIEGAEQQLLELSHASLRKIFGENPDTRIVERMQKELDSIIGNHYAVLYIIAQKLVHKSMSDGYHVGSRGSVGSSFIAFLLGISEVNPLPPHYRCDKCKHLEYVPDVGSGFDLP